MRKSLVCIIAVSLLTICLLAYLHTASAEKDKEEITPKTENATTVEVMSVKIGDITQELSLVGNVEARSQVFVFAKIPGTIEKLNVEVGYEVNKDDMLAVVEHKELELNVRQAKAALKAAQSGLNQAKKLSKIKVMSQVRQTEAGLSAAKAALAQVKDISFKRTTTQIAQAEAGLEAIKLTLKKIKEGAREEERKQVEYAVKQAKAGLDNAKSNFDRMQKLFDQGAISKQTLEGVETQYTIAKAQYEAAIQQMKLIDEGAREEDVQAVEAQVRQAEAGLELVKKMADTKSWEKDIAMAKSQVQQAEAGLETARALKEAKSWETEIIGAETAVEQANVALELAQKQLSDATITAPISGIVSMRNIELGGMAGPQSPIFAIVDMDVVKAKVNVIEANLYKVKMGNEARISVESLAEPVKGKVTLIYPTIDKMSRTTIIEISIDNEDLKLKPGMFVRANVIYDKHASTLLVPETAVRFEDGKGFAYTVSGNTAKKLPVQVGFTSPDGRMVEVLNGLSNGDKVIVSGILGLKDGTKVQVK